MVRLLAARDPARNNVYLKVAAPAARACGRTGCGRRGAQGACDRVISGEVRARGALEM